MLCLDIEFKPQQCIQNWMDTKTNKLILHQKPTHCELTERMKTSPRILLVFQLRKLKRKKNKNEFMFTSYENHGVTDSTQVLKY